MSNIYDTLLGVTTGNYNSAADSTTQNPTNNTKIYDADTVYQNGEGYRIEGIDAPEMPTKDLKLDRLQKAKESKWSKSRRTILYGWNTNRKNT